MIASRPSAALLFRRVKQGGLPAVVVGLAMTLSMAAAPTFWRVSTQAEFLRGEVEALSVDADGHLGLGPVTETMFDTTAPVLWSLVTATDDALWIGSGNDGRVYRVDPSGRGELVFSADASDVYALAAGPNGAVFAATSPDGAIYRVSPDGTASTLFDPDDTYVWALTTAPDGALLAATGDPARIHRIDPDTGEASVLFESDATHVLSIAVDPSGAVLAGTESPGQVLRIDQSGRAFVLLDSPHDEIRSVRVQPDGSVLVVAVTGEGSSGGSTPPAAEPASETSSTRRCQRWSWPTVGRPRRRPAPRMSRMVAGRARSIASGRTASGMSSGALRRKHLMTPCLTPTTPTPG